MGTRPSIQKLPEHVANQIAAGEVVERPAAVVKELVENSIDAGATQIDVAFQNGGKTYLLIEDNGHGMSQDEARLSLERHATSKLRTAEDLHRLMTFGFRGEALPSIASISEFSLATQTAECSLGTEIRFQNGVFKDERALHKSVGTRIEVRHLFHPVPARRKFLKTDATEAAHITQMMRLYALAYPKIGFSLKDKQRTVFHYPPVCDFDERLTDFSREDPSFQWINLPILESQGKRIWGKISKPSFTRTTREDMIFWVNHRPIKSRLLSQALVEGYQSFIPQGRFPLAFLFIEIEPKLIDVNVHPTKQEVRFRDEHALRLELVTLIRQTLEDALPILNQGLIIAPQSQEHFKPIQSTQPPLQTLPPAVDFQVFLPPSKVKFEELPVPLYVPQKPLSPAKGLACLPRKEVVPPVVVNEQSSAPAAMTPTLQDWRFLTHLENDTIGLFVSPKGLILLHYARANLRIEYEKILDQLKASSQLPHQKLLEPIALPSSLDIFLNSHSLNEVLEKTGFSVANGALQSIPNGFEIKEAIDWLEHTLHLLGEETLPEIFENHWQHHLSLKLAQKRPLVYIHSMPPLRLMQMLLQSSTPHTCPQGHNIYTEITTLNFFKIKT